jgi:hypothetical protein
MIQAQRITLTNMAGVALTFSASAGPYQQSAATSLLVLQSATVDLAAYPFPEGLTFLPDVVVDSDERHQPPPQPEAVQFTMNGQTVHYSVHGTIWDWTIETGAVDPPSGRPDLPGFPAQVPLNLLPFLNWDHQISAPVVPTCAPRTPDDVAAVCNWARDNAYRVRPRGVMHGWSPLTLPTDPATSPKVLLIDLTKAFAYTDFQPAGGGLPNRVRVGTGATLLQLLTALEQQPGGQGSASGFSFPHTPAPGNLTVGGMLAIDAHGTAVPTPPGDAFAASYGSISNQIVELVIVATDPAGPGVTYGVRTIQRTAPEAKALLTHLGRALVLEATLQVVDNYNLRCVSITDLPAATIFAAPAPGLPVPQNCFADFLNRTGRVEVIWFPFSDNPWLHTWQVAPSQPAGSIAVSKPYNYPFADYVPEALQKLITTLVDGVPSLTPSVGRTAALVTANGLDGENLLGISGTYPVSRDIWGPSKNSLLYIQDTTLKVTANGYAIHLRRADVQQAVHDVTSQFTAMLTAYAGNGQYPVNSALEIRVTALDDPAAVGVAGAESPVISALSSDATDRANGWDVAVWFDVLTIPGTPHANPFYAELEAWLVHRFTGTAGRVMPEWSKGWAYTANGGPWTDPAFLAHVRQTLTDGRSADDDWAWEARTLKAFDAGGLFTNPFLATLFDPAPARAADDVLEEGVPVA